MGLKTSLNALVVVFVIALAGSILLRTYRVMKDEGLSFKEALNLSSQENLQKVLGIVITVVIGIIINSYFNSSQTPDDKKPTPNGGTTISTEGVTSDAGETEESDGGNSSDQEDDPEETGDSGGTVERLTEIKVTEKNDYILASENSYITDNYGNVYTFGSVLSNCESGGNSGKGIVEYHLGGDYKTLTGTIFVPDESKSVPNDSKMVSYLYNKMFRVYGDDKLLYCGPALEEDDEPVDFAVNVDGVNFLTLMIQGGWYEGDGTGLIPSICVGNLTLSKQESASVSNDTSLPAVYLSELPVVGDEGLFSSNIYDYCSDINGKEYYKDGIIANGDSTGFVKYQLAGKYTTLKGTAYVPEVSIGQEFIEQPRLDIYVDDALEKTIVLGSKDSPEEFSIDVSGAKFVKIEMRGGWYEGNGNGLIPAMCVGDACLY